MKWSVLVLVVAACLGGSIARPAEGGAPDPSQIIVTVHSDSAASFVGRHAADYVFTPLISDAATASFFARARTSAVAGEAHVLLDDPDVVRSQPNFLYRAQYVPDDPSYQAQWHLAKTNVAAAWDFDGTAPLYGGDQSVAVAVLDTGISYEDYQTYKRAPDFATTSIGAGYDFVNSDEHPNDDNGHGTHVAMTIAESTGNGVAGAGIAFASTIMPIKVLDASGAGSTATIAAGVDFARTHGADIINLSLGGTDDDPLLHTAIQTAVADGIIVVAATGNDGAASLAYPARYSETISVGSTRWDNERAKYSNYGTGISLVAPGGQIYLDDHYTVAPSNLTTLDQNGDGQPDGVLQQTCVTAACDAFDDFYYEGTSQAAPQVSAAAALLLAAGVSSSNVPTILQETSQDLGTAGYDTTYGWGLLNVAQALTIGVNDRTPPSGTVTVNSGATYTTSKTLTLTVSAQDSGSSVSLMRFSNDGITYSSWEQYGTSTTWDLAALKGDTNDGLKTVYAKFRDAAGNVSEPVSTTITLDATKPDKPLFVSHAPEPYAHVMIASGTSTPLPTIVISWASPADGVSGIAGYRSAASSRSTTTCPDVAVTQELSVTLTASSSSQKRYVVVCAVDNAGNVSDPAQFIYSRAPMKVVTADRKGGTVVVSTKKGRTKYSMTPFGKVTRAGLNVARVAYTNGSSDYLVVAPRTSGNRIKIVTASGKEVASFAPYGAKGPSGVATATADLDGDGTEELIVTPLAGAFPLKILSLDGKTKGSFYPFGKTYSNGFTAQPARTREGTRLLVAQWSRGTTLRLFAVDGKRIRSWNAFDATSAFGVSVATGDFDGDGEDEIAAAPNAGASQIKVFRLSGKRYSQFFALSKSFKGGLSLASGPYFDDGRDALFAAPASGPAQVQILSDRGKVLHRFFTRPKTYRDGVTLGILR